MYWAAANLIWITVLLQIVFASKKDLGSVEKFNICESLIDMPLFLSASAKMNIFL